MLKAQKARFAWRFPLEIGESLPRADQITLNGFDDLENILYCPSRKIFSLVGDKYYMVIGLRNTEPQGERRRGARVIFRTTVKLSFADGRIFGDCETMDVSVSGIFVRGVRGVDLGGRCRVDLHLAGRTSNLALVMAGEIVRLQEDGVALQFAEVDEDSFYHLRNIVYFTYKNSGGDGDIPLDVEQVADETLYTGLDGGRKVAPLPDNYLDDIDESDDFADDAVGKIGERVRRRCSEDDY